MTPKATPKAAIFWRLPMDTQLLVGSPWSICGLNESIFPLPGSLNRATKSSYRLHLAGDWTVRFVPLLHLDLPAQFANPPHSAGVTQLRRHFRPWCLEPPFAVPNLTAITH